MMTNDSRSAQSYICAEGILTTGKTFTRILQPVNE